MGAHPSLTKAELVSAIAAAANIKKVQAEKAVEAFTTSVQSALVQGRKVTLVGFGTFSVSQRAARMGRDPRTKEAIRIPAKNGVKFKAGKAMREAVND